MRQAGGLSEIERIPRGCSNTLDTSVNYINPVVHREISEKSGLLGSQSRLALFGEGGPWTTHRFVVTIAAKT